MEKLRVLDEKAYKWVEPLTHGLELSLVLIVSVTSY